MPSKRVERQDEKEVIMEVSWKTPNHRGVYHRRCYQLLSGSSLLGSVGNVGGDDGV